MILIAAREVLDIPIKENHEKLVDVRDIPEILTDEYYVANSINAKHKEHTFVRENVAKLLVAAQKKMPKSWNIKLFEGHRSLKFQKILFDELYAVKKKEFPNLSHENIFLKTIEVVSPIDNLDGSKNIPPHSTGAAVDISIVDDTGNPVPMGLFPEEDLTQDTETFETNSTKVPIVVQEQRRNLCEIMQNVGFVNYPYEWWHYSYGDRYWAYVTNSDFAVYDLIERGL